jgi:hypothetical protein
MGIYGWCHQPNPVGVFEFPTRLHLYRAQQVGPDLSHVSNKALRTPPDPRTWFSLMLSNYYTLF